MIVGLAGDPEFSELYSKWGASLVDAATTRFGIPKAQVQYLSEKPETDQQRATGKSTRDEIVKAFGKLAKAGPEDVIFVVLIGHGTFDGRVAKFNLPGPDMTAADFEPLVKQLAPRRVVFINTASASGPFIEALSGPGRTIVTATRNGRESFATIFGGYFVDALASEAADADKNQQGQRARGVRFRAAGSGDRLRAAGHHADRARPARRQRRQGRNGAADGRRQGRTRRRAAVARHRRAGRSAALGSRALRALYEERRALERRVESLRLMKDSMDPQRYAAELEKVVTELALKTRQIREAEGRK